MSAKIRRQSIISSLVSYFGFAIGLLNMFFFCKGGTFYQHRIWSYPHFYRCSVVNGLPLNSGDAIFYLQVLSLL